MQLITISLNKMTISTPLYIEKCKTALSKLNKKLSTRKSHINNMNTKIISIISKLNLKYEGQDNTENTGHSNSTNSHSASSSRGSSIADASMDEVFILPNVSDYTEANVKDIESLLDKLEKIKLEKLDEIIEKTEKEVMKLSEKAFLSDLEILKFNKQTLKPMQFDDLKEKKLNTLEIRVKFLTEFINTNQEIFDLVNKWRVSFEELKEIEDRQKDPNRLKSNRGGALLEEAKKRRIIDKRLRNSESKLIDLCNQKGDDCPLLNGMYITEYLDDQNQLYNDQKEQEKIGRKLEKKKNMVHESYFGASSMSILSSSKRMGANPGSASKRMKNCSKLSGTSTNSGATSSHSTTASTTVSNHTSSGFRKPFSSTKSTRSGTSRTNTPSKQNATKQSVPNSRETTPSLRSGSNSNKENTKPYSNNTTRGRPLTKNSNSNSDKRPNSKTNDAFTTKNSQHMKVARDIKKKIERRRSRTPETLFREKHGSKIGGSRFRELPSHRAQPREGYGFRRRSKSHGKLNQIVEDEKELFERGLLS